MRISKYEHVLLKNGNDAYIVEIFEKDKTFLADINKNGDVETEEVSIEEIERLL